MAYSDDGWGSPDESTPAVAVSTKKESMVESSSQQAKAPSAFGAQGDTGDSVKTGGFGGSASTTNATVKSAFGSNSTSAAAVSSGFGSSVTPFGQSSTTFGGGSSGSSKPASGFGSNSKSSFGAEEQSNFPSVPAGGAGQGFGSTSSGFGSRGGSGSFGPSSTKPAPTSGFGGSAAQSTGFSSAKAGGAGQGFGSTPSGFGSGAGGGSGSFGSSSTKQASTFGKPAPTSGFGGSAAQSTGFPSAAVSTEVFGCSGAGNGSSSFGQLSSTPAQPTPTFGNNKSTFGGSSSQSAGFGGSAGCSSSFGGGSGEGSCAFGPSGGGSGSFGAPAASRGFGGASSEFGGPSGGGFGGGSGGGSFGGASSAFGGGGSSGFGGGSGGDRPRGCFNCGEDGHRSADCSQPRKPREGGDRPSGCFNCGEDGHRSAECTQPRKPREGGDRSTACFNCKEEGHFSSECTKPRVEDPDRKPPSTYIPEDVSAEELLTQGVEKGQMFERMFEAKVSITRGKSEVRPEDISPIKDFADLQLTEKLRQNISVAGYKKATPIQQYGMPIISQGFDMMACAQTGSGKTAAFLLPVMGKLLADDNLSNAGETTCSPRCVIIAPTRELAVQIYNEARKFAHGTIMYVKCIYGGTAVANQKQELSRGATILVATTGRLKHFISEGIVSLAEVKYLVLDEADRMLDMGFGEDINLIVSSATPKEKRQTLMFSATFPVDVQIQARELLRDDYLMVAIDTIGAANKCITQDIVSCTRGEKKDKLLALLEVDITTYSASKDAEVFKKKTLIFVSKKTFADTLGGLLCSADIPATTIHGDRLQNQRAEALRDFASGRKPVLVATAVAERGLDIKGVDHVINYDLPQAIDEYVHRIGRTGRVGNPGRATSFFTDVDKSLAPDLVKILTEAEQVVPEWLQEEAGCSGGVGFGGEPAEEEVW